MPIKKKRKSISESTALVSKPAGFGFPEEAIPNIPAPPLPGQAVNMLSYFMINFTLF